MLRRFARPRVLRTAIVGGAGFAIGRRSAMRARQAPESPPAPTAADTVARLKELAALHESGQLSDEEFAAAKRRVLGLRQP